jgi:hypothetical protein
MGVPIERGAHTVGSIPLMPLSDGLTLELPLHIIAGASPGPVLLLVAAQHGDESASIQVVREIALALDPGPLRGAVVIVPMADPLAVRARTRRTPADGMDLNRSFPGDREGGVTPRLAAALSDLIGHADLVVDHHSGMEHVVMSCVALKSHADKDYERRTGELARVYGLAVLKRGPYLRGSLTEHAAQRGIPAIVVETGGAAASLADLVQPAVRGTFNLLRTLGMLDGRPEPNGRQLIVPDGRHLAVRVGGLFLPAITEEHLDRSVPGGTTLGTIVDPRTFEVVDTFTAPFDDTVVLMLRIAPSLVDVGDPAFIVADMAEAEWVS